MTLIQWLIASADSDAYRAGRAEGMRHPKADSKMIRAMGGLRSLVNQARELENEGLIRVDWMDLGADIRQIHYSLDIIPAAVCQGRNRRSAAKTSPLYLQSGEMAG